MVVPSLRTERALLRAGAVRVCGMDEVGRGAVAGPVAVGIAVVDAATRTAPQGLRDSKLLTPATRNTMAPMLRDWSVESAVGYSGPAEIDEFGIMFALKLAGLRALAEVRRVDHVILDGAFNWLVPSDATARQPAETDLLPAVTTVIRGDRSCSSVAAASVIAKVDRDDRMSIVGGDFPEFRWDVNKGYSTPQHMAAIREHGLCHEHRRSWNLAGPRGRSGPE
jgi:ribonuclease HII